jgi:hypothetical protein
VKEASYAMPTSKRDSSRNRNRKLSGQRADFVYGASQNAHYALDKEIDDDAIQPGHSGDAHEDDE